MTIIAGKKESLIILKKLSFIMLSVNPAEEAFFLKIWKEGLFDCPSCDTLEDPNLFNLITSGIDGNTRTASSLSLSFSTAVFTLSVSSSTKIKEPMEILLSSKSLQKQLYVDTSRSSSTK
ncbi:unnamed protein product [Lathyrus oleraceus]